jgi:hypothetical protein
MIKKITLVAWVILVSFSCVHDTLEEKSPSSNLLIKTGTVCGWCSINDTLTINGTSVRYVNYTQCDNSKPAVEKKGQLITSELETLLSQLNFTEFKKLDLNSDNIAFDGCDDWIYFNNGSESHYIRFTRNDPKLQPIQTFVDHLNAIKVQYSGN